MAESPERKWPEAGPELDALVAELVMDLRVGPYSTDIRAAWEVVEWLAANHENVRIEKGGRQWGCYAYCYDVKDTLGRLILGMEDASKNVFGGADTAPAAICYAALEAVCEGGQVEMSDHEHPGWPEVAKRIDRMGIGEKERSWLKGIVKTAVLESEMLRNAGWECLFCRKINPVYGIEKWQKCGPSDDLRSGRATYKAATPPAPPKGLAGPRYRVTEVGNGEITIQREEDND